MGGRSSKAAGKRGEKSALEYLLSRGYLSVDKETQGLAGDDLFMQFGNPAPEEPTFFSFEIKNCALANPAWIKQAKRQAEEREAAIAKALKDPNSLASRLHVTFDKKNWRLMWHPKGWGLPANLWVVFSQGNVEIWR